MQENIEDYMIYCDIKNRIILLSAFHDFFFSYVEARKIQMPFQIISLLLEDAFLPVIWQL